MWKAAFLIFHLKYTWRFTKFWNCWYFKNLYLAFKKWILLCYFSIIPHSKLFNDPSISSRILCHYQVSLKTFFSRWKWVDGTHLSPVSSSTASPPGDCWELRVELPVAVPQRLEWLLENVKPRFRVGKGLEEKKIKSWGVNTRQLSLWYIFMHVYTNSIIYIEN